MTTPTVNETDATNMPGVYELLLDEDMTIDAGDDSQEMVFHITATNMEPVTRSIELYRPKITAGYTLGAGSDGDLLEVNTLTGNTAQTGDSYTRLGAPAGASLAADIAEIEGRIPSSLIAVDVTFSAGGDTTHAVFNQVDGAAASSTDDHYNGRILVFTAPAALKYQATDITDYVGSTKTATITAVTSGVDGTATAILL